MRNKFFIFLVVSVLLTAAVTPAFAENSMNASSSAMGMKQEVHNELKATRETLKETMQTTKQSLKAAIQEHKTQLHAALQKIKDQRKQQVVENIDTEITDLNKKYTDQWMTVLDNLQTRLDTLKTKAETQSTHSASLNTDITAAQTALSTAMVDDTKQAEKVYTIQIVSDSTLHSTVGKTVSEFRTDLLSVHKSTVDARVAVLKVATDLGEVKPSATPEIATGSAARP